MKLQVKQTGSRQELTIGSQKEFLRLWNTGVIAADDLVQRGEGWVRAGDLPWIHGMLLDSKRDGRSLFWLKLALMLLGLAGVVWIYAFSDAVELESGGLMQGLAQVAARMVLDCYAGR